MFFFFLMKVIVFLKDDKKSKKKTKNDKNDKNHKNGKKWQKMTKNDKKWQEMTKNEKNDIFLYLSCDFTVLQNDKSFRWFLSNFESLSEHSAVLSHLWGIFFSVL